MADIDEATPKSTRERISRHLRTKSKKKAVVPHLPGRIVPKKTGNNDPHRGGNRLHNEHQAVITFMARNLGKKGPELKTAVDNFADKKLLAKFVEHFIAVGMGGWHEENGKFINESGREASLDNWTLRIDRLVPVGGKEVRYQLDWLHKIRELCHGKEHP
jgi:hypothetical protein